MSLSGIAGVGLTSIYAQQRQDFQALAKAVNAGDISQAQQALSGLQGDAQATPATASTSGQTSQSGSGLGVQIKADFSSLLSAVQSGDITGAQKALASLQQDSNSASQIANGESQTLHHHHHHHGGGGESSNATSTPATSTDQASGGAGTSPLSVVVAGYTENLGETSP
jgi:hypothetical protein